MSPVIRRHIESSSGRCLSTSKDRAARSPYRAASTSWSSLSFPVTPIALFVSDGKGSPSYPATLGRHVYLWRLCPLVCCRRERLGHLIEREPMRDHRPPP